MIPIYVLACPECGDELERYAPITVGKSSTSCPCGGTATRRYTAPATQVGFQPHFNHSINAYVRTEREFKDHLERASDKMSQRMNGYPVNFQSVPIAEAKAVGVTDAGLDVTREKAKAEGRKVPRLPT